MSIIFRFCASIFIDKFQSAVSVNAFITLSGSWPNNDNIQINIPSNGIIKISASHGQFSALLNIIFAYTSKTWNLYKIIIKVSYYIFYYYLEFTYLNEASLYRWKIFQEQKGYHYAHFVVSIL